MLEDLIRDSRELVESPDLEMLKTWLDKSLSNLIYIVPHLSRRLDEVNSAVSFQPYVILFPFLFPLNDDFFYLHYTYLPLAFEDESE